MVKAPVPSVLLQFQGRREWQDDSGPDDWGLTPAQQESYVEQFRRLLAAKNAWREDRHDYYLLRRFLRARSYDLEKAKTMWLNTLKWRAEFGADTILHDFYFGERDKFLLCYPQGYHKTDKMGRPVYIQMLGQVNVDQIKKITTEDRMIKFHIQEYERCCKVILPVCSALQGRNIDQTFGIMDVRGVGLSHLTGEVKRLLTMIAKYDQDNYPEMLGHICIINAPSIFRMLWSMIKGVLDPRTQSKIEILGTDYLSGLLRWVDETSLPDWLGGKSHGSLLDDVGPWSDQDTIASLGIDMEQLRSGQRPMSYVPSTLPPLRSMRRRDGSLDASMVGGPSGAFRRHSDLSDGFHSPTNSNADMSAVRSHIGQPLSRIPDVAEDSQPGRLAVVTPSGLSVVHSLPNIAAVAQDHGAGRAQPLVSRIAAIEAALAPYKAQLASLSATNGDGGLGNGVGALGASSTRSAPQGSLLYRVEMLEEALTLLLAAHEVTIKNQEELAAEAQEEERLRQATSGKSRSCCCVVM